jgi:SET domain-containing protein
LRFALAIRRSPIRGRGAFAVEPIAARRKIGELCGERISVRTARQRARGRAAIAIVELSSTHAIDASRSDSPIRYVNHACAPNCYLRIAYGRVELYALRDVAAGEELTCDYGVTHHDGRLACRCGSAGCRRWL